MDASERIGYIVVIIGCPSAGDTPTMIKRVLIDFSYLLANRMVSRSLGFVTH